MLQRWRCFSHTARPTKQHPGGLRDVRSPACTKAQLLRVSPSTSGTHIDLKTNRTVFLNTRKTAVEVKRDALLVVTVKERDTLYLAVSSGCWVKRNSHITHGIMTVVFLMDHIGYSVLEHAPFHPYVADATATEMYLHVVEH